MMIKKEGVLLLFSSLDMDAPVVNSLAIIHVDDQSHYVFTTADIIFIN